jgi:hypothetical protein
LGSRRISTVEQGSHEEEIMIFPVVEYDARAYFHLSNASNATHHPVHSRREREVPTLSFFP